jgi:hypothetical protein
MKAPTKKSLIAALSAAPQVRCTMEGGLAIEDWPGVKAALLAEGCTESKRNPGNIEAPNGRFWMPPKFNRIRLGRMTFKSSTYTFLWTVDGEVWDSTGDVSSLKVQGDHLTLQMLNGATLHYEVIQ